MHATQHKVPVDRLHDGAGYSFKHGHVVNIYNWLVQYRSNVRKSDIIYQHSLNDRWQLAEYIKLCWSHVHIADAHYTVQSQYNNNERIYKRGRPRGSKNKITRDNFTSETDAIEEAFNNIETVKTTEVVEYEDKQTHSRHDLSLYALKSELTLVADKINEALKSYCESNFTKVLDLVNEQSKIIAALELHKPTIVSLERKELAALDLGVQHRHFPKLLKMCNASLRSGHHLNVWIYGPAGTGKSTAAEKIAHTLFLDFYTNGKLATEYAVLGFINTTGYQTTEFRKAYENGGIYLADEIDGSMPDALLALNGALANGHCVFPDKVVKRHSSFIFLAAANTTGTGATIDYVGRFKQDAAFNDRFVFLDWPLDEALEDSLVADKDWLRRVRQIRSNIQRVGIKGHLITPRAAIYGESLLAAGLSVDEVEQSVLKKGLSEAQWGQIK